MNINERHPVLNFYDLKEHETSLMNFPLESISLRCLHCKKYVKDSLKNCGFRWKKHIKIMHKDLYKDFCQHQKNIIASFFDLNDDKEYLEKNNAEKFHLKCKYCNKNVFGSFKNTFIWMRHIRNNHLDVFKSIQGQNSHVDPLDELSRKADTINEATSQSIKPERNSKFSSIKRKINKSTKLNKLLVEKILKELKEESELNKLKSEFAKLTKELEDVKEKAAKTNFVNAVLYSQAGSLIKRVADLELENKRLSEIVQLEDTNLLFQRNGGIQMRKSDFGTEFYTKEKVESIIEEKRQKEVQNNELESEILEQRMKIAHLTRCYSESKSYARKLDREKNSMSKMIKSRCKLNKTHKQNESNRLDTATKGINNDDRIDTNI